MQVAILGSGPTALVAAHAAYEAGAYVHIFSKGDISEIFGCQYLHRSIPGVYDIRQVRVSYRLEGTPERYREKVYGAAWDGPVSAEDLVGQHDAWDLRATYRALWNRYIESRGRAGFTGVVLTPAKMADDWYDSLSSNFDLVINTIPRDRICASPAHTFFGAKVWCSGDAPERGRYAPFAAPEDTVLLSGERYPSWYRAARVFGYTTVEWPEQSKPPFPNIAEVTKPLYTDCDCWPNIKHIGRYGTWNKSYLVHHAWMDTNAWITGRTDLHRKADSL